MGVFIHLMISRDITQEEWRPVYEEALTLAQKLKLASVGKPEIGGVPVSCLVPVKEETSTYGLLNEKTWTGFDVAGDYVTGAFGESNTLPKYLVCETPVSKATDPLVNAYLDSADSQSEPYYLLDGKTQGYAHHIPLLAICSLIQDRLGRKACVFGDITAGQCRNAVELANKRLDRPIRLPEQCEPERLAARIQAIPIPDQKKTELMEEAYLGRKDMSYGKAMRRHFGEELCYAFWAKRFAEYSVSFNGFKTMLIEYLDAGFDLERLCRFYSFKTAGETDAQKIFIETLLQIGLCEENKGAPFPLINPEASHAYGIASLFTRFFLGSGPDKLSERYIPQKECRATLSRSLGDPEFVNACMDAYLSNSSRDNSDADIAQNALRDKVHRFEKEYKEDYSCYDIVRYRDLIGYETGERIQPDLFTELRKYFAFYSSLAGEDRFSLLNKTDSTTRFAFLVEHISFTMRDCDWQKIYHALLSDPASFARYYPAARVELGRTEAVQTVKAILLNDALYAFLLADQAASV